MKWLDKLQDFVDELKFFRNSQKDLKERVSVLEKAYIDLAVAQCKNIQGYAKVKGKHYILDSKTTPKLEFKIIDRLLGKSFIFPFHIYLGNGFIDDYIHVWAKAFANNIIITSAVCLYELIEECQEYEKKESEVKNGAD